jgi:hypothetical protein
MAIAVLPLPPPTVYRRIFLVYRPTELVQFTSEIGRICRACLEAAVLPDLRRFAPWACAETVNEEAP